jgi:hypothetical protein
MKTGIFLTLLVLSCSSSNEVRDLIRGDWSFDKDGKIYVEITRRTYTVQNDSPIPYTYKIIGDTLLQTNFEGQIQAEMKIIKLTTDTLVLADKKDTLRLYKR